MANIFKRAARRIGRWTGISPRPEFDNNLPLIEAVSASDVGESASAIDTGAGTGRLRERNTTDGSGHGRNRNQTNLHGTLPFPSLCGVGYDRLGTVAVPDNIAVRN